MSRFLVSGSNSDLSGPFAIANKQMFVGTEGTGDITGLIQAAFTNWLYAYTNAADADRPVGNNGSVVTTIRCYQDELSNFLLLSVALARVNSGGTIQSETAYTAEQTITSSAANYTFTNTNPDLGFWKTNDRMLVEVKIRNAGLSGRNIHIESGGTTTAVDANLAPAPPLLVAHS